MVMVKERNSNFELLRIISMFLIVFFHSFLHAFDYINDFHYNKILYLLICLWGILGTCCFVYIIAWFGVREDYKFKFSKILKIILETIFYGLVIVLIFKIFNWEKITDQHIHDAILFFFSTNYWFITAYIFLMLLIPFLNKIIFSLKNNDLKKLVIILTMITGVYKTFFWGGSIGDVLYFIDLYLLIGYLKLNPGNFFERNAKKGFVLMSIFSMSVALWFFYVNTHFDNEWFMENSTFVSIRYSFFMTLTAIFLFYIFKNLKIKNSKFINVIASSTLGVYLIHENPLMIRIWNKVFSFKKYLHSRRFIFLALGSCFIVYTLSTIIDLLRKYILKKIRADRVLEKINFSKIDNFFNN